MLQHRGSAARRLGPGVPNPGCLCPPLPWGTGPSTFLQRASALAGQTIPEELDEQFIHLRLSCDVRLHLALSERPFASPGTSVTVGEGRRIAPLVILPGEQLRVRGVPAWEELLHIPPAPLAPSGSEHKQRQRRHPRLARLCWGQAAEPGALRGGREKKIIIIKEKKGLPG